MITDSSNFDIGCSGAHFMPFLFYYYCTVMSSKIEKYCKIKKTNLRQLFSDAICKILLAVYLHT